MYMVYQIYFPANDDKFAEKGKTSSKKIQNIIKTMVTIIGQIIMMETSVEDL